MTWPWTWICLIALGGAITAAIGVIGSIIVVIGCFGLCVLSPIEEAHNVPVPQPTRSISFEESQEMVFKDERGRAIGLRQSRVWKEHS